MINIESEGKGMATYKQIQNYVRNNYGFSPKTCWIAHMKELCGLPVAVSHNRYSMKNRTNPCPPEKQPAIRKAFQYFGMLHR